MTIPNCSDEIRADRADLGLLGGPETLTPTLVTVHGARCRLLGLARGLHRTLLCRIYPALSRRLVLDIPAYAQHSCINGVCSALLSSRRAPL